MAKLADEVIDEQINATGFMDPAIEISFWSISLVCMAWYLIAVGRLIAALLRNSSKFEPDNSNH